MPLLVGGNHPSLVVANAQRDMLDGSFQRGACMLAILLSVLCFQAESAAKPTADADQLLQSITDQLQLEVRTAEEAHAQRREMLFTAFAADLQQLQKDLTRTMKFDEALQVRSLAERFSK